MTRPDHSDRAPDSARDRNDVPGESSVTQPLGSPSAADDGDMAASEPSAAERQSSELDTVVFSAEDESRLAMMQRELTSTRVELDKSLQDMEAANEELRVTNEELLALNEELQTANMELEISRAEAREAEEAATRASADLENLLRSTQIATLFLDHDFGVRSFTPAATKIYRLTNADIGRPLGQISCLVREMPPMPDPSTIEDAEPIDQYIVTDQNRCFMRRVLPYRSGAGEPEGMVVTFIDVTESRRNELLFQSLVEASSQIVWIATPSGEVVDDSPSWRQFTGQTYQQWKGAGWINAIHPDDRPSIRQHWQHSVETSQPLQHEYRVWHHSGVWRWTQVHAVPLRHPNGTIDRWVGMNTDITQRKQRELKLAFFNDVQLAFNLSNSIDELIQATLKKTADFLDLSHCCLVEVDKAARTANVTHDHARQSSASLIGRYLISDFYTIEQQQKLLNGHAVVVEDTRSEEVHPNRVEAYRELGIGSTCSSPYVECKRINYAVSALKNVPHRWTEDEISIIDEVAERLCVKIDRAHTDAELADREAHLRRVLDNAHSFISVLDLEGAVLEVNALALETTGLRREDLLGDMFWNMSCWTFDTEVAAKVEHLVRRAIAGEMVRADLPYLAREDEQRMVDLTFSAMRNAEGQLQYVIGTGVDITERERAKEQLRASEDLIRTTAENSTQAIIMMDDRGYLTYCNQACLDMTGYTAEEIRSAPLHDLIHHHYPDGRPYPMSECPIDRALPEDFSVRAHEDLFFRKDGSSFPVSCAASPIFRDGVPVSTVIEVRDITEQKKWLSEILDREAHLRRVIDGTLGFVGILDTEGILLEANTPAIEAAGVRRDEVIGKPFWETYWWNFDAEVIETIKIAVQNAAVGEAFRQDIRYRIAGDQRRWVDFSLTPLRGDDGTVTHLIPSGVDITDRKEVEQTNRESAAKLRALFDNAFYYIGVLDLDGNLVDINESSLTPFGFTFGQTVGKPFWETPWWQGFPKTQAKLKKNFGKAVAGEVYRELLPFKSAEGGRRYIDFIYTPAMDDDGNVLFVICNGSDVTEQVLNRRALVATGKRLDLAMSVANAAAWSWDYQHHEVVADANLKQLYGYQPDETMSYDDLLQRIDPAHRKRVAAGVEEALKTNGVFHDSFKVNLPSGKTRWLHGRGRVELDRGGKPKDFTGFVVDITEQKEQERRILASEERLRLALSAAELKLWQWDLADDDFYLSGDFSHRDRLEATEPIGSLQTFLQLVHPEDRQRVHQTLHRSIADGSPFRCEYRIADVGHSDASSFEDAEVQQYRWVVSMAHLSLQDSDSPTQMIGVELDITQRHEFEQSLREARAAAEAANEAKSAFLANMSHEIRTPMTAIMGYTDLLAELLDQEEAVNHLRTIRRNGDFLLEIINDILDLSKIEANKLEIIRQRFAPDRLVEDVRSIMDVRATEGGLDLSIEYHGKIPAVIESDPRCLRQILINLVGNAIKFTQQGGVKLVVRFQDQPVTEGDRSDAIDKAGSALMFEVIDSGIGISEAQQKRLFRPFSQGDDSVSRKFGGTGLGLAISQRLAAMLGGKIAVQSQPGQGSTFTITIATGDLGDVELIEPRVTALPQPEPKPADEIHIRGRVLIVDDRRDIRFLSRQLLSRAGATVTEAEDGEQAVATVTESMQAQQPFDMVILDMQMPKLDGYETARALRRLGYAGPIIALTADAMQGDMNRCLECGCNDYLSKPIDKAVMLRTVRDYITGHKN